MSDDAKMIVVVGAIVSAILGSTWIVSNVMIRLTEVVRADLQDLRDSLERAACGALARHGSVAVEFVSTIADPAALMAGGFEAAREPGRAGCSGGRLSRGHDVLTPSLRCADPR